MDFTGFLGNDAVKARLSGAFASGRVAHSYLLCGPAGSGKHMLTRILSAAMQCEGRSGEIPCGVCCFHSNTSHCIVRLLDIL